MKKKSEEKRCRTSLWSISMLCVMALTPAAFAQIEKTLEFIPDKVDFGKIREEDGKVSREVKAINISNDSTFIISARTSCGCSGVEYPKYVIAPGDTIDVTVTYDPVNRPGKFLKTARFFTGPERISNSIKLSGTVIPSRNNLDKSYPEKSGSLRLSTMMVNAGEMSRTEARPLFVGLYNDSETPLVVTPETDAAALEAGIAPDTIEAYGIGTLTLMLKGRLIPENDKEIFYRAFLVDASAGDTVVSIPVGAIVK